MRLIVALLFLVLLPVASYATHNRAGEITYRQIGPLTIEMTITTYTKTSSSAADRDSIFVIWGDGEEAFIDRSNDKGEPLGDDVKKNLYIAQHTFPGRGTYTIGFIDPNRVGSILNVNWPNSIDVPFYLGTTLTLLDPQFQGINNSAILLQPPVDRACVGRVFTHNPNAFDIDGDSLSYELVAPRMSAEEVVPGYRFPNEIGPGDDNNLRIDPKTGMITWDSPQIQGEYNIAIRINEWRNGVLLNSINRDMQIFVSACNNYPPVIETVDELCVIAGDSVRLPITVSDPDIEQQVKLTATGFPFQVSDSPATISATEEYLVQPFNSVFSWKTNCTHINKSYYQVVLKATDNGFSDTTGLSTLYTVRIKVIAPEPEDVEAQRRDDGILLTWALPYRCENTPNEFFQGFSVWRSEKQSGSGADTCLTGINDPFYKKIAINTRQSVDGRYYYLDEDLEEGKGYCYRILAEFAPLTDAGFPYNRVESRPSQEACVKVKRDRPILTKISVIDTDIEAGSIDVHFSPPDIADIENNSFSPPYTFELYRSTDKISFDLVPGFTRSVDDLGVMIDTTYLDTDLNTTNQTYYYKILLRSSSTSFEVYSLVSSSIFARSDVQDRGLQLSWSEDVAWTNTYYEILEKQNGNLIKIGQTTDPKFEIKNLDNDETYCYIIQSVGSYYLINVDSIRNYSQEVCNRPMDIEAPCSPALSVVNFCSDDGSSLAEDQNTLYIQDRSDTMCITADIVSYSIYFKEVSSEGFEKIATITEDTYEHVGNQSLPLGCYYVTATDGNGNESVPSSTVCTEICPAYVLPNTFTPNSDGHNDTFHPRVKKFVDRIDLKIYNQWGNLVFETNDPDINWDGRTKAGKILDGGTYYYTCTVEYATVTQNTPSIDKLRGIIQIIR